ncbi:MAG: hypothetical protein ACON4Z_13530 [Planctomycetota bacterium]
MREIPLCAVSDRDLRQVVADVLEQMAFVFVDDATSSAAEVLAEAAARARLPLEGAADAAVLVAATAGLVREVASGMTGCELAEVDAEAYGPAVVAELANVFGGEWVLRRAGSGGDGKVGLPRALCAAEASALLQRAQERGAVVALESELGALVVSLDAG